MISHHFSLDCCIVSKIAKNSGTELFLKMGTSLSVESWNVLLLILLLLVLVFDKKPFN